MYQASIENQLPLQFPTITACAGCRYRLDGRCDGRPSVDSMFTEARSVVGCRNPLRQYEFSRDLYGSIIPKANSNQGKLRLPTFVPMVKDGLPATPPIPDETLVAVSMSAILRESGTLSCETPEELRKLLRLPEKNRLGLIVSADDAPLERFWKASTITQAWSRIGRLGLDFVTSFSFSAWTKMPRWDQIFNQDRNLWTHDALAATGVPVIPFVFPVTDLDLAYVIEWLNDRPDVEFVSILAQYYRNWDKFSKVISMMDQISSGVKRSLSFLLVGVAGKRKIDLLMTKPYRVVFVSAQPFSKALHGQSISPDLHSRKAFDPKHELFAKNLSAYNEYFRRFFM